MTTSNTSIRTHRSTTSDQVSSRESSRNDIHSFIHPWGLDPTRYLEEVRRQSRTNKLLTLKESLTAATQASDIEQQRQQNDMFGITQLVDNLKVIRTKLSNSNETDLENATLFGWQTMLLISDLVLHVVHQIGQTNVITPRFGSIIAYIRSLIHTRSAHMRQTIPGSLLISWYDVSDLMSALQHEPELRITVKKARQLLNIAQNTAAWAYKHLSSECSHDSDIGFIDRSSIPYTYE